MLSSISAGRPSCRTLPERLGTPGSSSFDKSYYNNGREDTKDGILTTIPSAIMNNLCVRACTVCRDSLMYHRLLIMNINNLEPLAQEVYDPDHPATTYMTAVVASSNER